MSQLTGILQAKGKDGLIRPLGKQRTESVFIPEAALNGAPFGMLVVVELDAESSAAVAAAGGADTAEQQGSEMKLRGRVVEVLGEPSKPDVGMNAIIRSYGLREAFPPAVLRAARRFPLSLDAADVQSALEAGRRDFRGLLTVTIDGIDAKDLDDAISLEMLPKGGYRLWVHIADVSHYVKEDSALDKEARLRGNSSYLADRVLPMLPPALSNGICSLNPQQDRFALSLRLDYDAKGERLDGEIYKSVIRSDYRMNYDDVYRVVYQGAAPGPYRPYVKMLRGMRALAEILKARRAERGCLNFNFPETQVVLDETGRPTDVRPYPINAAHELIEAFMIAANVYVAERFRALGLPFLYRVHERPDPVKLKDFIDLVKSFGVPVRRKYVKSAADLAALMDCVKNRPYGPALSRVLLQCLAKARYDAEPLGHYGLSEANYCHFTSPIRRYPDLFIHRVVKASLGDESHIRRWRRRAPELAESCSAAERASMYAEFDSVDLKVAEYMQNRLGETFRAQISNIISAGLFVQLEDSAEGFVPFRTMRGYYALDPKGYRASARESGRSFSVGDAVAVVLTRASVELRQLEFMLQEDAARLPREAWQRILTSSPQQNEARSETREASKHGRGVKRANPIRPGKKRVSRKDPRRPKRGSRR